MTRAKYNQAMQRGQENKRFLGLCGRQTSTFSVIRGGDALETYGEDPYLTSTMGISVVKGLQGPRRRQNAGNCWHAPSIMLFIPVRNGQITHLMSPMLILAICMKHTFRHSERPVQEADVTR